MIILFLLPPLITTKADNRLNDASVANAAGVDYDCGNGDNDDAAESRPRRSIIILQDPDDHSTKCRTACERAI